MSTPDPITRLNAALEGRYRIESELGEGGMARSSGPAAAVDACRTPSVHIWALRKEAKRRTNGK